MRLAAILLLSLLFVVECNPYVFEGVPHYIKTGSCESGSTCVYNYYKANLTHGVDIQKQNVTVNITFEVACNSTGEYAYHKATRYCLENFVKQEGMSGREDKELHVELSGWFCFVQIDSGKIPIVLHSSNENQSIVNFKKALVSGFQANFDGTNLVEEMDPESVHMSHYRYVVEPQSHPRSGHMFRHFTQTDMARIANPFPINVDYSKEEDIEYREGELYHASGETHLVLPHHPHQKKPAKGGESVQESLFNDQHSSACPRREATSRTYDPSITLNHVSVHSTYTLDLAYCSDAMTQKRRSADDSLSVTTTLVANTDHVITRHLLLMKWCHTPSRPISQTRTTLTSHRVVIPSTTSPSHTPSRPISQTRTTLTSHRVVTPSTTIPSPRPGPSPSPFLPSKHTSTALITSTYNRNCATSKGGLNVPFARTNLFKFSVIPRISLWNNLCIEYTRNNTSIYYRI